MVTWAPINCQSPRWCHRSVGLPLKTQRHCHGNAECAAMAVVVVVVGEGLLEGKCVCVCVCVIQWCLGHPVESAITQKPLQLQEEKGSTVSQGLTHTHTHTDPEWLDHTHTHAYRPPGCWLSQLTFTQATHGWPIPATMWRGGRPKLLKCSKALHTHAHTDTHAFWHPNSTRYCFS